VLGWLACRFRLEGFYPGGLHGFPLLAGVDPGGELPADVIAPGSGGRQSHLGVGADAKGVPFACDRASVVESPEAGAICRDQQIEASAVA